MRCPLVVFICGLALFGCEPEKAKTPEPETTAPVVRPTNFVAPLQFGAPVPDAAFSDCTDDRFCKENTVFPTAAHAHPTTDEAGSLTGVVAVFLGSYDRLSMQLEEHFGAPTSQMFAVRKWQFTDPVVRWETDAANAVAIDLRSLPNDWSPTYVGQPGVLVYAQPADGAADAPVLALANKLELAMVPRQDPYVGKTFDLGPQNYVIEDISFELSEAGEDGQLAVRYSVVSNIPEQRPRNATLMLETVDGLEGPSDDLSRKAMGRLGHALDAPVPLGYGLRLYAVFKTTRAAVGTPGKPATLVVLPKDRSLSPVKLQFYDPTEVAQAIVESK